MSPIIERLQKTLFAQSLEADDLSPLNWTYSEKIKSFGPEFYSKIIPSHMVLNMEYSLLGQQIRTRLLSMQPIKKEQIIEQLVVALLLAELLEHVYQHYLMVPREVRRLRDQQKIYRQILLEINAALPKHIEDKESPEIGLSFTQSVRGITVDVNLYRLLFIRSKRALDLIAALDVSAIWYRYLVGVLDKYIDPILPHVAWIFFMPRLSVNLFLLLKHIIPGWWMEKEEKDLGFFVRLQGQLLRRWFELGNDLAWFSVAIINCFILTGILAPFATYLGITFFGYDVLLSAGRAFIELNRLYQLRQQYQDMMLNTVNKDQIEQHIKTINEQINFQLLRLGSHLATTVGIFFSMLCMAPIFAVNPIVPIVAALCLVLICLINFALVPILDHYRPKDIVELPKEGLSKLGFFAAKNESKKGSSPREIFELEVVDKSQEGYCL